MSRRCYTNHALDQFLENLIKDGIDQVIRIGGQSKSAKLEPINLRNVTDDMEQTKAEKHEAWNLRRLLEEHGQAVTDLVKQLRRAGSLPSILDYLRDEYPQHHRQLEALEDAEGFRIVNSGKGDNLTRWLNTHTTPQALDSTPRSLATIMDLPLLEMQKVERRRIYDYWVSQIRRDLVERLDATIAVFADAAQGLKACNQEISLRCLQQAHVIGVTTSGLARNIDLLGRLRPKVLLCEEAGEILEAHTLTAFLPTIEHAILIGDHEQLRPQIQNYELSLENPRGEKYSLDKSTFERLITDPDSDLPYDTLQTQRRMDPSISDLVRNTLYPRLIDHESVLEYPEISGMRKRLYWLDHKQPEAGADPTRALQKSRSNDYEVGLVAALVAHLVRQGVYKSEDIVVLTPYVRQLQKIRNTLASSFEIVVSDRDTEEINRQGLADAGSIVHPTHKAMLTQTLRIATVDNFQGEESNIVIVSLVRSNKENQCGFLRTTNRINVLLRYVIPHLVFVFNCVLASCQAVLRKETIIIFYQSRAKYGMYIIGDAATSSHIPMWKQVINMLKQAGNMGDRLPLCCPQHPNTIIEVTTPEDFLRNVPEGGCSLQCDLRLDCGHACTFKCHSKPRHDTVICQTSCERRHPGCNHACPERCGVDCGPCRAPISNVSLPCGHLRTELPCHKTSNLDLIKCVATIEVVGDCGHSSRVECGTDPSDTSFKCKATCGADLACGHQCRKRCYLCRQVKPDGDISMDHGACGTICQRYFSTCAHACGARCHGDEPCPLCTVACPVQCSHSRCGKKCQEPCAPCLLDCVSGCDHQGYCQMPCAIPCDVTPCSRRCDKSLMCGHRCPSVCGEKCPSPAFCQVCASTDVKGNVADYIMGLTYADIDLDKTPCIVPDCGHVISIESLDGHMELASHYEMLEDGVPQAPLQAALTPLSVDMKGCPLCRGPLRNINRYGRIVKRALLDESTKKFIVWSNAQFVPLTTALQDEEETLSRAEEILMSTGQQQERSNLLQDVIIAGSRSSQIAKVRSLSGLDHRLGRMLRLRKQISTFQQRVRHDEQPFGRIRAMTADIALKTGLMPTFTIHKSILQTRAQLLTASLQLRCDYDILSDLLIIHQRHKPRMAHIHPWLKQDISFNLATNRRDCLALAEQATEKQQPMVVIEARLHHAKFAALERIAPAEPGSTAAILVEGRRQLDLARVQVEETPSTSSMMGEVENVEKMLREETFYTAVTSAEKQAIYLAMAQDFRGTGHWYYCENMHPVCDTAAPRNRNLLLTLIVVHDWRVRHADGDFTLSPVRRSGGRPIPHHRRWRNSRRRS